MRIDRRSVLVGATAALASARAQAGPPSLNQTAVPQLDPSVRFQGHRDRVDQVKFGTDGTTVFSNSSTELIQWNAATGDRVSAYDFGSGGGASVLIDDRKQRAFIYGGYRANAFRLLDLGSGRSELKRTSNGISHVWLAADKNAYLALRQDYGKQLDLAVIDRGSMEVTGAVRIGARQGDLTLHGRHADLSRDYGRIVGIGNSGIEGWDFLAKKTLRGFHSLRSPIQSLHISPDGEIIVSGSLDGVVKWDAKSGRMLAQQTYGATILPVSYSLQAVSADFRHAVIGIGPLYVIAIDTFQIVRVLRGMGSQGDTVFRESYSRNDVCAFSPNGKAVVAGSAKGTLLGWNLE